MDLLSEHELSSLSDEELVQVVLEGRDDAFRHIYERFAGKIFSLVQRMVGARDAEEVTQEAFVQAYRNLAKFRGESKFYTWFYRVASNTALQHLRKRGRRESRQSSFDDLLENAPGVLLDIPSGTFADPQKSAEDRELQEATVEAFRALPPNQKMTIVLGPLQGLSYDEMARVLQVTVPVVKARLHRARENLRNRVGKLRGWLRSGDSSSAKDGEDGSPPKKDPKGSKKRRKNAGGLPTERGPPGDRSAPEKESSLRNSDPRTDSKATGGETPHEQG